MKHFVLENIHLPDYNMGANYYKGTFLKGGVCIFVQSTLKFSAVSLNTQCIDKVNEVSVIKLKLTNSNICVLSLYRAPSGEFNQLLDKLDGLLKALYLPNSGYIICGDFNINYLTDNK